MFCLLDNWNTPSPQNPNNSLTKGYASKVFVTNFILFAAAVFSLSEAIYQRCYNIHGWTGWYIIVRHTATSYIVHFGSGKVKIILLQSSVCKFWIDCVWCNYKIYDMTTLSYCTFCINTYSVNTGISSYVTALNFTAQMT